MFTSLTHTPIARRIIANGGYATQLSDESLILTSADAAVSVAMNMVEHRIGVVRYRKPGFLTLFQDSDIVGYIDNPDPDQVNWVLRWLEEPVPIPSFVTQVGNVIVEVG